MSICSRAANAVGFSAPKGEGTLFCGGFRQARGGRIQVSSLLTASKPSAR